MKQDDEMKDKWFSGELSENAVLFASTVEQPVSGARNVRLALARLNAQMSTLDTRFRGKVADREFLVFESTLVSGLIAHGVVSVVRDEHGLVRDLTIGLATGAVARTLVPEGALSPLDDVSVSKPWSPSRDYAGPPFLDNLSADALLLATIRPEAQRGAQPLRDVVVTAGAFYKRQALLFFGSSGEWDFMVYEATLESGEEIRGAVALLRDAGGTIVEMLAGHSPASSVIRLSAHLDRHLPG